MKSVLGIDFGSNAVRAILIDAADGRLLGSASATYAGGENGIYLDSNEPLLARQHPDEYLAAMAVAVRSAIAGATDFDPATLAGIGTDATGSTPIPVTESLTPLARLPEFAADLNAYSWMWKDHTSHREAAEITQLAATIRPQYLQRCGGAYSSEWFWSKIFHALRVDRAVFDAAYGWLEFSDFIPAVLCGVGDFTEVKVSVCGAGHKAMYAEEWGGLPDEEFLAGLAPELAALRRRLARRALEADRPAGVLCAEWAEKFGLPAGIPVAMGIIDAHAGAVGSGVGAGRMVKIIGTSCCDIMASPGEGEIPDIPGICGIVNGSVLPGHFGFEAGQSAVGDIFDWFVTDVCGEDHRAFREIEREASALRAGASGLLALDWHNGNRNPYCDQALSGLVLGMTLHTTRAEFFRAWVEATAYGARRIVEQLESCGVGPREIICAGGIPRKSPLLMQVYADVLGKTLLLPKGSESCALGAAILGAVAGRVYDSAPEAQLAICGFEEKRYVPDPANVRVYDELYRLYVELSESFSAAGAHGAVMKKLLALK